MTRREHAEEGQPEDHPPLEGTNRKYIPPCADTRSGTSPKKAEARMGQREGGRHPESAHQSWTAVQREAKNTKTREGQHMWTKEAKQLQAEER